MSIQKHKINYSSFEDSQTPLPLIIEHEHNEEDINNIVVNNKLEILNSLYKHGGILFRGFNIDSIEKFEQLTKVISPELEEYYERSTPRSEVQNKIYTSTEYPSELEIHQHNENSYQHAWPLKIWFYASVSPQVGGETPISSSRAVYNRLDKEIKEKFIEKKVMYVRNFSKNIDLPWQEVFQTNDPRVVDDYCKNFGIETEWISEDKLRTIAVRDAVSKHPVTRELVWFNQAHLFHYTNMPIEIRDYVIKSLGEENLPKNVYYGDGTAIDHHDLEHIRNVYEELKVSFSWRQNDVLLLDNMLTAHGRSPYKGDRKILVAMSDIYSNNYVIS